MSSVVLERRPKRYANYNLKSLVRHLEQQSISARRQHIHRLSEDRKMHMSCTQTQMRQQISKPFFNNKTKQHQFFDKEAKSVPYIFIPKYKNDTFIIPDRFFAKGAAAKRMHVQMKDTSVFSFRDNESLDMNQLLHKRQKQKVVTGRKMEQLNRILDSEDGKSKCNRMKEYFITRKKFNPTSTNSEIFSQADPMIEPRDSEVMLTKKTNLQRTFDVNRWRPNSSTSQPFTATFGSSFSGKFSDFNASVK